MQGGPEGQVVNAGELLVDALNEIVLDGGYRQGAGGDIGSEIRLFPIEQRHSMAPPPLRLLSCDAARHYIVPGDPEQGLFTDCYRLCDKPGSCVDHEIRPVDAVDAHRFPLLRASSRRIGDGGRIRWNRDLRAAMTSLIAGLPHRVSVAASTRCALTPSFAVICRRPVHRSG